MQIISRIFNSLNLGSLNGFCLGDDLFIQSHFIKQKKIKNIFKICGFALIHVYSPAISCSHLATKNNPDTNTCFCLMQFSRRKFLDFFLHMLADVIPSLFLCFRNEVSFPVLCESKRPKSFHFGLSMSLLQRFFEEI